jgi:hypothetical protein
MKHDLWMAVRENSKDFVSECLPDEPRHSRSSGRSERALSARAADYSAGQSRLSPAIQPLSGLAKKGFARW